MNKKKVSRWLSMLLAFMMLLGALPVNMVTAQGSPDIVSGQSISADDGEPPEQPGEPEEVPKEDKGETQTETKNGSPEPEQEKPEKQQNETDEPSKAGAGNGTKESGEKEEEPKQETEQKQDAPEPNNGSISGVLWLDDESWDGIREADDAVLANFPVSLHKADDMKKAVDTVKTGSDGKYEFKNLEPGEYRVKLVASTVDGQEYLVPMAGITADSKFVMSEDWEYAMSEKLTVKDDSDIKDIDAGMRLPMGAVPYPVNSMPIEMTLTVRMLDINGNPIANTEFPFMAANHTYIKSSDQYERFDANHSKTIKTNDQGIATYTITARGQGLNTNGNTSANIFVGYPLNWNVKKVRVFNAKDNYKTLSGSISNAVLAPESTDFTPLTSDTPSGTRIGYSSYSYSKKGQENFRGYNDSYGALVHIGRVGTYLSYSDPHVHFGGLNGPIDVRIYEADSMRTVTETFRNAANNSEIKETTSFAMANGSSYSKTPPATITSGGVTYKYIGWKDGSGALQNGNPSLTNVTGNKTVNMMYAAEPTATTSAATNLTANSATLNGTYNTQGIAGNVYYQYGTTTSYGSTASYNANTTVTANTNAPKAITGLTPGTTYNYRLVVVTAAGTKNGPNMTFTTPRNIKVTYNYNYSGAPAVVAKDYAQADALSKNAPANPTRTGYTFTGWSKSQSGALVGMSNAAGTVFPAPATTGTLYAQWTPNEPTISLNTNATSITNTSFWIGGVFDLKGGTRSALEYRYRVNGSSGTWTTGNISTITGNTFGHSITGLTPGTAYEVRAMVKTAWGEKLSDSRVYTTARNIKVTYNYNFVGAPSPTVEEYAPTEALKNCMPANPTRHGCIFMGWSTVSLNGTVVNMDTAAGTLFSGTATTGTLYAQWKAAPMNVTLERVDRDGNPVAGDLTRNPTFSTSYQITEADTNVSGYLFRGYQVDDKPWVYTSTRPSIPISDDHTIKLLFGRDSDGDGHEDFDILRQWMRMDGTTPVDTAILPDKTALIQIDTDFALAYDDDLNPGVTIPPEYTYKGYRLSTDAPADPIRPGKPELKIDASKRNTGIIYLFEAENYGFALDYVKRDGTTIPAGDMAGTEPAVWTADHGTRLNETAPAITGYIYVGWKLDGVEMDMDGTHPNIAKVTGGGKITLVYGNDKSGSGKEDLDVTRHWVLENGTAITGLGDNPSTVPVDVGDAYQKAHDAENTIPVKYNYLGYYLDGETVDDLHKEADGNGKPDFTMSLNDGDRMVYYVYELVTHTIQIKYEDRDGNALTRPSAAPDEITVENGDDYTMPGAHLTAADDINGYVLAAWYAGSGTVQQNTTVKLQNVTAPTTITLVYGNDDDGDGNEDITFTVYHVDENGTPISAAGGTKVKVNVGDDFDGTHIDYSGDGYDYKGYSINDGALHADADPTGSNAITVSIGDRHKKITYHYELRSYKIKIHYVDRDENDISGVPAAAPAEKIVKHGKGFEFETAELADINGVPGYLFADWYTGSGGTLKGDTHPKLENVSKAMDLYLVYGEDSDGDGTEDFDIYKKYTLSDGAEITGTSTQTLRVKLGDPFDFESGDDVTGYTYAGYRINGGTLVNAPLTPDLTIDVSHRHMTVSYVYTPNKYKVTVQYQHRNGETVHPSDEFMQDYRSEYLPADPGPEGYMLVDWKVDGTAKGNDTLEKVPVPAKDIVITLVYGYDMVDGNGDPNPDGKEDYRVTEEHRTQMGGLIRTTYHYVNGGGSYAGDYNHDLEDNHGYTYVGYEWESDGFVSAPAVPSQPNLTKDHTVTYSYTPNEYPVIVEYVDKDGNDVAPQESTQIVHGNDYTVPFKTVSGMLLSYWTLDGGTPRLTDSHKLENVVTGHTIRMVYGVEEDGKEQFTVTKKFQLSGTNTQIKDSQDIKLVLGDTFDDTHDAIAGYAYAGYIDENGASHIGDTFEPALTITHTTKSRLTFTYLYTAEDQDVQLKYEKKDGAKIKNDHLMNGQYPTGTTFALNPGDPELDVADYTLIGWKLNGETSWRTGTPSITVAAGMNTIILRYGHDRDGDGDEDIRVSRELYSDKTGERIPGTGVTVVGDYKAGETAADTAPAVPGYDYNNSYTLVYEDGEEETGTGGYSHTVTDEDLDVTVIFHYTPKEYKISVEYVNRAGETLKTAETYQAKMDDAFSVAVPEIENYTFVQWELDGTVQTFANPPKFTVADGDMKVTLIYGHSRGDGSTEDIRISRSLYSDKTGAQIPGTSLETVDDYQIGEHASDTAPAVEGYTYNGNYTLEYEDGTTGTGTGSFSHTVAAGDLDVVVIYHYTPNTNTITVQYIDRDGTELQPELTVNAETDDNYTVSIPFFTGYVFAAWQQDGKDKAFANPPTARIPAKDTVITLIYGDDSDGDGKEDITFTKQHLAADGTTLRADETVTVNAGDTFADTAPDITGYHYNGYKVNDGALQSGQPEIIVKPGDRNMTVVYIYSTNQYTVTVRYVDRDGKEIGDPNAIAVIRDFNENYTPGVPVVKGYLFVDWYVDNGSMEGNRNPGITVPAHNNTVITLVYGQDGNGDGKEDATVTVSYRCEDGTKLRDDSQVYVNLGTDFSIVPNDIAGHTYLGYQTDKGNIRTGNPKISDVRKDHAVTVQYSHNSHLVTVTAKDTDGNVIGQACSTHTIKYGEAFSKNVPQINGYQMQYWTVNGGKRADEQSMQINSVEKDSEIIVIYRTLSDGSSGVDNGKDDGGRNGNKRDPYANIDFIKKPNIKDAAAGELVPYTFAGFGNSHPFELTRYSIIDKPEKGLDFKSASLPAFTKGAGVTYDITVYTNKNTAGKVIVSGASADRALQVTVPNLSEGEYVTAVELYFGTVPAGFAVGDIMEMTFQVWQNPPKGNLVNVGLLSYDANGEYKQFISGGSDSGITINGWFPPVTGDNALLFVILPALLSGTALTGLFLIKRRRNRK